MIELTEWYRTRQISIRWRIEKIIREDIHYSSWGLMICRISSKLRNLFHSQIICILVLSFFLRSVLRINLLRRRILTVLLRYIVDDQDEVIRFPDNIDTIVYQEAQDNQSRHDVPNIYIYILYIHSQLKSRCQSPEIYLYTSYRIVFLSLQTQRRLSDLDRICFSPVLTQILRPKAVKSCTTFRIIIIF